LFIFHHFSSVNLLNYLLILIFYVLGRSNDVWISQVVEPATKKVTSFLSENGSLSSSNGNGTKIIQRDLWTQYTCKVCYVLDSTWHGAFAPSVSERKCIILLTDQPPLNHTYFTMLVRSWCYSLPQIAI
jgi:hypothetical protein